MHLSWNRACFSKDDRIPVFVKVTLVNDSIGRFRAGFHTIWNPRHSPRLPLRNHSKSCVPFHWATSNQTQSPQRIPDVHMVRRSRSRTLSLELDEDVPMPDVDA